ncbi:MAG: hypothetical protein GY913_12570 [Proteobacteria bacterium]|nr:hypothetical protein [Pseudomonadota bacterium]MCP4917740.1 hypothetical protein [Pseudomonadota bacterium]
MHPDIEKLYALWQREVTRDGLLSEWRGLHDAHKALEAELVEKLAAANLAQKKLGDLKQRERETNRKLETYQKRRDNAQRTIDTGTASDFRAAEAQVSQCGDICDQLETDVLELMEQIDAATTTFKGASDSRDHMAHRVEAAKTTLDERLPTLKPEFEDATAERDDARDGIWRDQIKRYDMLRKKKYACFATVEDMTCGGCHTKLDGQRYSNLTRDTEVVTCRHCGRFLVVPNPSGD